MIPVARVPTGIAVDVFHLERDVSHLEADANLLARDLIHVTLDPRRL